MNDLEKKYFDFFYLQHLTNLTLQGKRPETIDAYSCAVRLERTPDTLSTQD